MENLSDINSVKAIMNRFGFSFSKGLGQNFIVNPTVCPKIAELGGAEKGVGMIEIGAGFGTLTNELAKRAEKVVAVELDSRLLPVLEYTLSEHSNVKVINADILKTDLNKLIADELSGLEVRVCANLPYYLTSPIIMYLLEGRLPIKSVTIMVQKEAAVRLCAPLGTREVGAVTVAVNYFAEPHALFDVGRGSFMPQPNVDSRVIRLDIRENPPKCVLDEKMFFKTVRAAFCMRRKTLLNSVSAGMSLPKGSVREAISAAGLPENIRPEQMSMEDFAALADKLSRFL